MHTQTSELYALRAYNFKVLIAANCPLSKYAAKDAVKNGHLECLKLLLAASYPLGFSNDLTETIEQIYSECLVRMIAEARAELEYLESLTQMIDAPAPSKFLADITIREGCLEYLKSLIADRPPDKFTDEITIRE